MRKRHLHNEDNGPVKTCCVCATEGQQTVNTFHCDADASKSVTVCDDCLENYEHFAKVEFDTDVILADAFESFAEWCKRECVLMFTDITDGQTINNEQDVKEFFDALTAYLNWHPDTNFSEYVRLGTDGRERVFSDTESKMLNEAMGRCFSIASKANKDIYSIGLDAFQRADMAPKEVPHPETASNITPLAKATHLLRDLTNHLREARDENDTDHKLAMLDGGIAEELIERGEALVREVKTRPSAPVWESELQWFKIFGSEFAVPPLIQRLYDYGLLADCSGYNDICPSFTINDGNNGTDISLWVDHPDKASREMPAWPRYRVSTGTHIEKDEFFYEGDSLENALATLFNTHLKAHLIATRKQ